ncbi:flagellar hook-length control protein FliK [Vampirovibrio sp.]|uniref:flagellar hook-length control protein FliK n=1 Tax=Vampirovibrio sp. TaxID=2717857 RepID=UPI003593737F
MTNPLDFIQTLSQKVLSGKKAGAESPALTGESGNQAEAFSSALNQALQPKSQPVKPGKPDTKLNDFEPLDEPADSRAEDASEVLLPADLLALQPMVIAIELPPPAVGITQALSQLAAKTTFNAPLAQPAPEAIEAMVPAAPPLTPQASIQTLLQTTPGQQPVKAQALPVESTAETVPSPFQSIENLAETTETAAPKSTEKEQDKVLLAQSLGFSTLSPEAMLMMGIPVEFQIQNAIQQIQTQPTAPAAIEATQPLLQSQSPAWPPTAPAAELELDATLPTPAPANLSAPNFENTLQQAISQPDIPNPTASPLANLESAFVIEDAAMSPEMPAMAPMLELPNGPDSLQFNQVLTESGLPLPNAKNEATPVQPLETLDFEALDFKTADQAPLLPLQQEAKTPAQNNSIQPSTSPSVEALLNPLSELQQTLDALDGEIESIRDTASPTASFEESTLPEEIPASEQAAPTASMFSDIQAPINLNSIPTDANASKLPQFLSSAADPADQVVDGTVYSVKNGHKELILKINPDNLGEVRINLTSMGEKGLSARLIASNPESHALLKNQAETLKASLEAQGVHVERLSIVLAGQTETSSNAGKQEQPPSQSSQQQTSSSAQQQQSFQQPEQNLNPFFQSGGPFQNKSGFAQNPGSGRYGQSGSANEPATASDKPIRRNDNGSVSVLA